MKQLIVLVLPNSTTSVIPGLPWLPQKQTIDTLLAAMLLGPPSCNSVSENNLHAHLSVQPT